ncbi:hypothetical protein SAMN02910298_00433 [Pseudobutyrivibrio sp. YE44]|uniref:hypothetical protein n=1 Tax=Pseudobutyrivibrio sp. YE44 TaxID=1520802 RepID=UPI0008819360|nr:hypothetical protein [Pseudobutyrivibrio sp. YE44]SDB09609.1 hypothetical protein SAMN02910298_00433 [Pseudobutyrivibrio sp. YE44]
MIKKNWQFYLYGLFVFVGMLLFFTVINPLVVYDADDWLYIYAIRLPIPLLHSWNPTRIFPEVAMPSVSAFAAFVINPILNNYCRSLTLAHGLFGSILFTIYFVQFSYLFYKRKIASLNKSIAYGCLFILLHFISHIFMGSNNFFMIGAIDLTCFYYYTLSAILNATLVMHFMSYGSIDDWFKNSNLLHKIIIFICLYFAIFSNLFSSVVLATYVGTNLLLNLLKDIKNKSFVFKDFCINNWLKLVIIAWWFLTNILETTGGRADGMHKSILFNLPISLIVTLLSLIAKNVFITILDLVVFITCYKLYNKKLNETGKSFVFYIGFTVIYIVLLSASVNPNYAMRTEVSICSLFYLFMGMILCLNELIKANKKYNKLPLILAGTILLLFINPGTLLQHYNYSNISYDKCEAVMNDFIDQVKTAEQNGQTEIVLEIPRFEEDTNWPISDFVCNRVVESLYIHQIVDTNITCNEVNITDEKNEQFGISPESWYSQMSKSIKELLHM